KTGEQAAHLTRQMLAYAGKGRFVLERLDLGGLFGELTGIVTPAISKKIELRHEFLPGALVMADRSQMQQVFTNLVLNAAEAIGGAEGVITIRTGERLVHPEGLPDEWNAGDIETGRFAFLEVCDTGCGMD